MLEFGRNLVEGWGVFRKTYACIYTYVYFGG